MAKIDETKPKVGRESMRLEDLFEMLKLPKNKWVTVRFPDLDVLAVKRHWINIIAGKDKREVKIPKICVSFDPNTEGVRKGKKCCYDDLAEGGKGEIFYLVNAISRDEQENKPRKTQKPNSTEAKTGAKELGSESWTPMRVVRVTSSLMKKIQGLKELNKRKIKGVSKAFSVTHPKFGADVNLKHDPDAKGAEQYQASLGDKCELTEEEAGYLFWAFDADEVLDALGRETPEEARAELKRMQIVGEDEMGGDDDDDDDEAMDLGGKKSSSKKSKKSSSKKSRDDDDGDDDDDGEDDDDDRPSRNKKSSSKKSRDDDDDDEDGEGDDDGEDDDDDDRPSRNKKSTGKKPAAKASSKSSGKKTSSKRRDDDDDDIPF